AHYGFSIMPRRMAESLAEHRAIRDALRAGRLDEAAALVVQHEQSAYSALAAELESAERRAPAESAA
ncbi:GntR family transcriptional regulator, partial [Rhizobiaceae sp. 2RAB30]